MEKEYLNNNSQNDIDKKLSENNIINCINDETQENLIMDNKIKNDISENIKLNNINNSEDKGKINSNNINMICAKIESSESNNNMDDNQNEKEENCKKNIYISEIKKYLDHDNQNKEYMDIINKNPGKLFELLNDRTIITWQSIIYNFEATLINSDGDILTVCPERKDQQIIINDCNRTRFRESPLVPGFKKILEEILTFYCNIKGINYKQGLNEIFGPLILMKYKLKYLKLLNIFNLGEAFIDRFLPNYFYEKDLYSLKSSINIFVLLFKYHEPNIFNYLDSFEIPHELYAANWLITLRSQKLNLDLLYNLWDNLIKINDPIFIHFILVALIKYKREL